MTKIVFRSSLITASALALRPMALAPPQKKFALVRATEYTVEHFNFFFLFFVVSNELTS